MNLRKRFKAVMSFEPFDRLPVVEWAGWWDETLQRWYKEGLPLYITDRYEICEFFGLDVYKQFWLRATGPDCPEPTHHGAGLINGADDYEKLKNHLFPQNYEWLAELDKWREQQEKGDIVVWFTIDGAFWFPRKIFGIENHLLAFYDQPDLMRRMINDLAEWTVQVIDEICAVCRPDFMAFAEDMSYNNGPMLSEKLFNQFLAPYYNTVIPHLLKYDVLPIIDSDGDVTEPARWFESVGIQGILPLERQAGVDIVTLRENHPQMKFIGHFDKMTMMKGERAMRAEFARLLPVAAKGGFIPACDHQTPPQVSLENYKIYVSLFKEFAKKAAHET